MLRSLLDRRKISEAIALGSSVIDNIICNSNVNDPRVSFIFIDSNSAQNNFFKIKENDLLSTTVNISANNQFDFETKENHVVRLLCVVRLKLMIIHKAYQLLLTNLLNKESIFLTARHSKYLHRNEINARFNEKPYVGLGIKLKVFKLTSKQLLLLVISDLFSRPRL